MGTIEGTYVLYIDGRTTSGRKAEARVRDIFKKHAAALRIIDVANASVPPSAGVIVLPCLVRERPEPRSMLILHSDAPEEIRPFITVHDHA
jgi:hypothetical protein